MGLLNWEPRPPALGMPTFGAKRYQHAYIIVRGEDGFAASYQDQTVATRSSRFIAGSLEQGFSILRDAQAACEADLKRILGRRH